MLDFIPFLFSGEGSLEGRWERVGDRFAGCVIEVEPEKNGTQNLRGRIVHLPPSMATAGWIVGDIKWQSIQPAAKGTWKLDDLRKHFETQTGRVIKMDFQPYRATLGLGGLLRLHSSPLPFFPEQNWKRVEPEESDATAS
jgi:hypothetical protein